MPTEYSTDRAEYCQVWLAGYITLLNGIEKKTKQMAHFSTNREMKFHGMNKILRIFKEHL